MRLVWREMALKDRIRIMEHISEDNPAAAIVLDETFRDKARRASLAPTLYKAGRCPGTREIVVRSNYVMIYRIMDDRIEIIRILHARQQWP
ncbi:MULTISPECIES: type II toxin-antitoxin system RelE/ParE family toxin [Pseudomonas]|uniref:Type II toxin-antitoxin system RelE/ParE family toxin n=1 Tax=Pseudomonas vlassakiae TaxID=485888 RepID=A0A923GF11_9PSED|nr:MULTISPECIES: type II toxin-antitoxin system RelE/ParE family toxin [Pseudomonas]MBH3409900.1 type II toxin-antitoxin system RelE/ParE family toxin [Pseudomonas putida]MBV4540645.1 type II toxin-antitoxin system RelE/ParE family toxin [Pseudomonas vlassakiae]